MREPSRVDASTQASSTGHAAQYESYAAGEEAATYRAASSLRKQDRHGQLPAELPDPLTGMA